MLRIINGRSLSFSLKELIKNDSAKKVEIEIFDAYSGSSSAETNSPAEHRHPSAALKRKNEVTGVVAGAKTDPVVTEMPPLPEVVPPPEMPPPEVPPPPESVLPPGLARP